MDRLNTLCTKERSIYGQRRLYNGSMKLKVKIVNKEKSFNYFKYDKMCLCNTKDTRKARFLVLFVVSFLHYVVFISYIFQIVNFLNKYTMKNSSNQYYILYLQHFKKYKNTSKVTLNYLIQLICVLLMINGLFIDMKTRIAALDN